MSINLVETRPKVTCEQAIHLSKNIYGVHVPSTSVSLVKELISYDDRNFYLQGFIQNEEQEPANLRGFLLKVSNPAFSKSQSILKGNSDLLLYLSKRDITCPVPYSSRNGDYKVLSKDEDNADGACAVRLFSYVSGSLLEKVALTEDVLYDLGASVASMHKAMKDFSNTYPSIHELSRDNFIWNIRNAPRVVNKLSHVFDCGVKLDLINTAMKRFQNILSKLDTIEKQIIHGDMNEKNILVQEKLDKNTFGFIDFNDFYFSNRVVDLGIALAYIMMLPQVNSHLTRPQAVGHMFAGYQSEWPLPKEEVEMLGAIAAARCSQSLVVGAYQHAYVHLDNEYLLVSQKGSWKALNSL
ncbi:predicted protein, partial [Nematostella vectensis]